VVIVPTSSVVESARPYTHAIRQEDPYFKETGLRRSSQVKWSKPLTISKTVVQRRLGSLDRGLLQEIQSKVRGIFRS